MEENIKNCLHDLAEALRRDEIEDVKIWISYAIQSLVKK